MTERSTARTGTPAARGATTTPARPSARTPRSATRGVAQPAGRSVPTRADLRLVPAAAAARPSRRIPPGLRSRRAPLVLFVVALLVATTVALLVLNTAIAVDSLKATELRAANAERAEQVQRLEQRVVSAGTPAEVAAAAEAAGLVPAGPAGFLVVAPDGSSTLRGTPEPAEAPPAPATPATPAPATPAPAPPAQQSPAAPSPGAQSPAAPSPGAQSPAAQSAPAAPSPAPGPAGTAGGD